MARTGPGCIDFKRAQPPVRLAANACTTARRLPLHACMLTTRNADHTYNLRALRRSPTTATCYPQGEGPQARLLPVCRVPDGPHPDHRRAQPGRAGRVRRGEAVTDACVESFVGEWVKGHVGIGGILLNSPEWGTCAGRVQQGELSVVSSMYKGLERDARDSAPRECQFEPTAAPAASATACADCAAC